VGDGERIATHPDEITGGTGGPTTITEQDEGDTSSAAAAVEGATIR
jgi:hypothetical protein